MSDLNPAFQAPPASPAPTPADVAPKPVHEGQPSTTTNPEPAAAAPAVDQPNIDGWLDGKTPDLTVENASKVIAAIREDFKAQREKLRNGEAAKQAVAEAEASLALKIGKALGVVKDDETPADPNELKVAAQNARVELAVFKMATAAGADPAALLDSASFLAKVRDIDPTDSAAVTAAITEAVASNPRLGAAPTSRTPAPNPAQGSSGGGQPAPGRPKDLGEALTRHYDKK